MLKKPGLLLPSLRTSSPPGTLLPSPKTGWAGAAPLSPEAPLASLGRKGDSYLDGRGGREGKEVRSKGNEGQSRRRRTLASTPPGPSFWPAGGVRGKAKERVEGIAQPYHALVYAHQTTSPAGRARGGRYGGLTGHEGQDPPPLYLPPKVDAHTRAIGWINQGTEGRGLRS